MHDAPRTAIDLFDQMHTVELQRDAALQYAGELAAHNGRAAAVPLQQGLEAARTLAAAMVALKASGHADRQTANAILRSVRALSVTQSRTLVLISR